MNNPLLLNSWVSVTEDCKMRGMVDDAEMACFVFDDGSTSFEFAFDVEGLRQFVSLATSGLETMDDIAKRVADGEPLPEGRIRITVPQTR